MELLSLRSESETSTSLFSFRISRLLKVDAPEVFCPYVECQNVRITPGQMIFDNAIEGKTFYEKITIQNLGKNPAFIRVGSANSYAFHIKPIPRGMKLSPGLILERHITFKCLRGTSVSTAIIPVFINDERVDYRLFVFLSATDMKAEPTSLNFGVINARNNAVIRMLSIFNDGSKGSRFTIDLGRNDMDLIVEPSKGIIQPNSVTKFRVECLGTTEGNFSKEFWIKCETPLRIGVTGKVINPEVQPVHPNATSDFTLIDFPKTYVGTTFSKTFVLKNHSSSHGAFCTFIENGKNLADFREGRKIDPSAFNFGMVPTEGIMEPFEARIFEFTYAPKIIRKKDKLSIKDLTSFCCLRITRVPFTTLPKLEAIEYDHDESWDEILPQHIDDTVSITSVLFSLGESSLSILPSSESSKPPPAVTFHTYNTRIVLFGEAELPKVTIRPDCLNFGALQLNESVSREILLTNYCLTLPIIFQYKKACCVKVQPATGTLSPNSKIELAVTVTPTALGTFSFKLQFDLLFYNQPKDDQDSIKIGRTGISITYEILPKTSTMQPKFNMGITPTYIKEVGKFTDDVRFNTNIEIPRATLMNSIKRSKKDDDLVAFPNDRPQSLRPWNSSVKCRTICANLYRTTNLNPDEYQLTEKEVQLKKQANEYFREIINYQIKFRKIKLDELQSMLHYDISNSKEMLLANFPKIKCIQSKPAQDDNITGYIPLMPSQLNKVKVYPATIDLGKIAPRTSKDATITIDNKSSSSIAVFLKSRKPVICFPSGQFVAIESMKQAKMQLSYHSSKIVGRYCVIVDCIINCCDTFAISISVDVTPKCVKFPFEDVILSNCVSKFITVVNPVNVKTEFSWKLPESCFIIEPLTATIPSYSSITCFVKYIPHQTLPYCIDATLCSENGAKQIVNLTKLQTDPKIRLRTPSVEFSYISVNTTVKKTTGIENLVNEPMAYVVENPEPIPGISVTPTRGTIPGFGEEIFEIRVRIATCIAFKCPVTVNIQNRTNIEMVIAGTVIYPHIVFKPDVMKLRKIVANSFERQVFVIVNKSNAAVTIDFCLNDYVEYTILESRHIDYYTKPLKRIELEANSQKELYLYFNPMGAALFSFYLPIMINEVFGPAVLNSYQTLSPNFYTTAENAKYVGHNTVQILQLPKRLPILFINSSVGCDILKFSKLNFHFKFYSHRHTNTDAKSDLIIWNASPETCKFCIRTDALRYPFSIQLVSGNDIQFLEYSMVVTLEPKEEITFKVIFDPMLQGTYFVQLPIYLRNYLDGSIFNYLTFSGYYPSPTIFSNEKEVYFEPVPITCETEQKVTLNFEFHSKNCSVATEIDNREIKVQFCEISVYHGEGILTANIKYMSKTSMSIDSSINFYCTCGANYRIYVKGCVENCCVTNHAFVSNYVKQGMYGKSLIGEEVKEQFETASSVISLVSSLSNHNSTSFPFFPSNEDRSEYASHMRSVVIALEDWISHQGFYGKKYFKIPDSFAVSPQPLRLHDFELKKKKSPPAALNYIGLLANLVGSLVYNYVTIMEIPLDDLDRINYMYNSYRQALNLVSCQGAYLSHVAPENLLPYIDHVLFIKHIYPNKSEFMGETPPEILSKDNYFLLCKQLWIDVLLQTYKVFVLGRVTVPVKYKKESFSMQRSLYRSINSSIIEKDYNFTDTSLNTTITKISEEELSATSFYPLDDSDFWSIFDDQDKSILYNTAEQVLMRWLEFYSNKQITKWCESSQLKNLPVEKTVTNFDYDLQNGVVLIAVTLEYCSYLAPYLKDIYMNPSCSEQSFHNASKVIQSWNVIGLSFGITPTQINNPNCLHMLMLVNYLYQVLPSFNANNKLMFKTNLSETCSKQILIENISQYAVAYKIIILGNKRKLFSVVNEEFVIQPLKKYKLFITFHAKFLDEEPGIMILNGECSGKAYAKTIAVELIGQSILSYSTTTINIPLNVYEVKTVELDIQSPYINTAKYEINFSLSEPHKSLSNIFSAASTLHSKIPRRIVFFESHVDFDELGVGILTVILCSITNNEKSTWIIFRNPSIGDFTINIITTPSPSPGQYLNIQVPLDSGFNRTKCLCRKDQKPTTNPDCPRRLVLKIPCRNEFLWDTCAELILQVVKEEDFNFWKEYLGTRPGVQIIQWLTELEPCVEDYYDIAQVFQTTVKYFVTIENQSPNIIISPISIIRDVLSTDSHELFIHVSEHEHNLKGFTIKMESRSGFEHRYYNIDFISKRSICIQ